MSTTIDIEAAARRINENALRTPLLNSPLMDDVAGRRILVKAECLQKTGSFKFRGAWSAISALPNDIRDRGVIAYSSGNHAQGVALAARMHAIPAVIVMPADAPKMKVDNTRAYGAEVVLYDRRTEDRDAIGVDIARARDLTLIRPYDEPNVIAGQGTIGLELVEQLKALGVADTQILVPCGGGGLTSGTALALEASGTGWTARPCEPECYDDTTRSLAQGSVVANPGYAPTICDAIMTPQPGNVTFPIMHRLCGPGLVVSDDEVRRAIRLAFNHLKIVVEPGGAIALAAALSRQNRIDTDTITVIASGGNVDPHVFASMLSM
ncbi:Threo-3-hydroxyaspartate ammonia-lyase [Rhizobium sp. CF080]|uniref:threonine ammonia-lyase n=1 Tax=Rhizobium sp. (strain CF080) TaxID=1144310 RepID=UPI0002715612|nr:threonine/serine dehydratase [Rhizobium sp. CF080]EUB99975.1 Threo-3-hydroxyaspartate ammonia-lyase [Rhizobium sp. CF080]